MNLGLFPTLLIKSVNLNSLNDAIFRYLELGKYYLSRGSKRSIAKDICEKRGTSVIRSNGLFPDRRWPETRQRRRRQREQLQEYQSESATTVSGRSLVHSATQEPKLDESAAHGHHAKVKPMPLKWIRVLHVITKFYRLPLFLIEIKA